MSLVTALGVNLMVGILPLKHEIESDSLYEGKIKK